MSVMAQPLRKPLNPWVAASLAGFVLLALVAVTIPNLQRSRSAADRASAQSRMRYLATSTATKESATADDRKIVRSSVLELMVTSPQQAAEKIRLLAENLGGYLEGAQIDGSPSSPSATLTIRVPAARMEDAKAELRKLATWVDGEKTEAADVTKQYVDTAARIRNLRAEEAQYLQIMKSAAKVQDLLAVSAKLSEVRGQIEQQQAEFQALSKQVELATISVSLRAAQTEEQVFGIHWRPLYRLKLAAHEALEGLADYASIMTSFILYLPVVLLWVGTIVLGIAAGWRIFRWGARVFFALPKTNMSTTPAS